MNSKNNSVYELEVTPVVRYGLRVIELRHNGRTWREEVNTDSYAKCTRALKRAVRVVGLEGENGFVEALYQEVLARADQVDSLQAATQTSTPPPEAEAEVDDDSIARPELIHTPEVSAILLPVKTGVVGEGKDSRQEGMRRHWELVVCWHTQKRREAFALPRFLELPEGDRLWLDPWPGEPQRDMRTGWTESARRAWLNGEPGPGVVSVYKELYRYFTSYLVFPRVDQEPLGALLALYTMLTYTTPVWETIPYLHITGGLGVGKTRVLDLLRRVVFRPFATSSTTSAVVFRRLHLYGGTLLVDEADKLRSTESPQTEDLIAILNAGNRRDGFAASRSDTTREDYPPQSFYVYGPKVLASIHGSAPTLASRSIMVTMIRADRHYPQLERTPTNAEIKRLTNMLHAWALTEGRLITILPQVSACPPTIYGRARDLWAPILALAQWIEDEEDGVSGLHKVVLDFALRCIREAQQLQFPTHDEVLLRALAEFISAGNSPTPGEVLKAAQADPGSGHLFKTWTPRRVSEHLAQYGLKAEGRKEGRHIYDCALLEPEIVRIERTYGVKLLPTAEG